MTRILVTSWLPADARSGVGTYMRKLQDYFKNDGEIDITFLLVDHAPLAWRALASVIRRCIRSLAFLDRRFIELSFEMYYRLLVLGGLTRYRDTHFDVINAQDILSGYTARKYCGNRVPLVLTCHFNNNPVEEDMLRYGLQENARSYLTKRYKRKFAAVDEFIFVAGFTIRTAGFLLPAGARTTVIYNGLDFTPTTPRTRSSAMLAILNTGHVEERKNQRLFIALAKELLRRDFRDFRITLVGTGPDVQELQHIIDREGLSGYILLAGWSDDIPAFLAETDLYIHTSLLDTCPYSVVEAISAGVPALAFNVGGLPEMLPEDTLFAPNDHIAMVDYLLGHQQSLAAIGARQYERARHDFSRTVQVERLRSVYTSFNRKP